MDDIIVQKVGMSKAERAPAQDLLSQITEHSAGASGRSSGRENLAAKRLGR
jgi:hypothetical protein